ncbi:MAG TPA: phosphoribosyltransferase family protein [Blastocatellia bacterium]|nr:phosphoribosyltransferase family protein [Blastocatellia bacterium]
MRFRDRREAGWRLAGRLIEYAGRPDVIVLALPRGGVPVAYEIARAIGAPLDVFLVRKLGVPGYEDLAMGTIATGGVSVLNEDVVRYLDISDQTVEEVTERERRELERRERLYRGERAKPDLAGRAIILVDDGLATDSTMRAAGAAVREHRPARVIIAVPVTSSVTYEAFNDLADGVVCVAGSAPDLFYGAGLWYDDFSQTTDEEARVLLAQSAQGLRLSHPDEPAISGSYNQERGREEGAHFRSRGRMSTK